MVLYHLTSHRTMTYESWPIMGGRADGGRKSGHFYATYYETIGLKAPGGHSASI